MNMTTREVEIQQQPWKNYVKVLFRFVFLYFFIQAFPLDWKYYSYACSLNWLHLHYGDIFNLTRYMPAFYKGAPAFANWAVIAIISLVGTFIWSIADRARDGYNTLYYWLRVIVRYRLAIGVIAYGFLKFYPMQSPYPSISNLNTHYGYFTRWKLFSLSLGIVPGYEAFLGLVEITAGLLLFYRKTATIGAFIIIFFTGNVFLSNLAYDGGEMVYSLYLVLLALFVFAFDAVRLYQLIGLGKPVKPNRFKLHLNQKTGFARMLFKGAFIFFFVFLYGFKSASGYHHDPYQYPTASGLADASGLYNVSVFRINHNELPYSAVDPVRWKDVVFEKWATISIRSNRPVVLDRSNTEELHRNDVDRNYELAGSGERQYYSYKIDEENQMLVLQNKNKHYQNEKLVLFYSRPDSNHIVLRGLNERSDSVYVVLDKLPKKYLLEEAANMGRRKSLRF